MSANFKTIRRWEDPEEECRMWKDTLTTPYVYETPAVTGKEKMLTYINSGKQYTV